MKSLLFNVSPADSLTYGGVWAEADSCGNARSLLAGTAGHRGRSG
jgi:hypothetical protein